MRIHSLNDRHRKELLASGLTDDYMDSQTLFRSAEALEVEEILGFAPSNAGGLVIEYPNCQNDDGSPCCRVKPDRPRLDGNGKQIKYETPRHSNVRLYIPPLAESVRQDASKPLCVVEGEKKGDALCCAGIPVIAVAGVDAWRQKPRDADGNRIDDVASRPIADLNRVEWQGRVATIIFDSPRNQHVDRAERALGQELARRGATVGLVRLPEGDDDESEQSTKMGADDFIVANSADAVKTLIQNAMPLDLVRRADWVKATEGDSQWSEALRQLLDDVARYGDEVEREAVRRHLRGVMRAEAFDNAMRERARSIGCERRAQSGGASTNGESNFTVIKDGPDDTPYAVAGGRFWYLKHERDGVLPVPLTNFTARIVEDVTRDDGAERTRFFTVEGTTVEGKALPTAKVPSHQFDSMAWISREWGVNANLAPDWNAAGRVRYVIKLSSEGAVRREIYAHLGWRNIGGEWCFLHAGGAVGAEGIGVELAELQGYRLPSTVEDLKDAVQMSLSLLDVAPRSVTIPCLCSAYRAVTGAICPPTFTIWLYGESGSLKSTLTALFLNHFGGDFDDKQLSANWSSTANELEALAFRAKDVPFVIDDFAPQPSRYETDQLESKAHRLIRAQGNRQGRQRMRRDRTDAPTYFPQGLLWVTGEQLPSGLSVNARVLPIEVPNLGENLTDLKALTGFQKNRSRLAHATRGFIEWIAPQYEKLTETLPASIEEIRACVRSKGQHLRQPEVVAHLYVGLDMFLTFAVEVGACELIWADKLRKEALETLIALTTEQSDRILQQHPTRRFLSILRELFTQGRAHLRDAKTNQEPAAAEQLGWDVEEGYAKEGHGQGLRPGDDQLGWADADFLYLMPEVAYRVAAKFCEEAKAPFPVKKETLLKALADEGYSVYEGHDKGKRRNTAVISVQGSSHRVIKIYRAKLEPEGI